MEKIGKLVKQNSDSLALRLQDTPTTIERSSELLGQVPQWVPIIRQMAQDKRQDLAPGILSYWREKLKNYPDAEICDALLLYAGEFFPSVDDITKLIDRRREVKAIERQNAKWPAWKASQAEARKTGRLATEEQYAELRAKLRQVAARTPEGGKRCYQEK